MPSETVGAPGSEITRDAVAGGLAGGGLGALLAGGVTHEGLGGLPAKVRMAVAIPAAVAGAIVGGGLGAMTMGGKRWFLGKDVKTAALDSAGLAARGLKRMRWGARISAHGGAALERGEMGKAIKSTQTSLNASRRGISDFGTSRLGKTGALGISGLEHMGQVVKNPARMARKPQLGATALRKVPGMGKVAEDHMPAFIPLREAIAKLANTNISNMSDAELEVDMGVGTQSGKKRGLKKKAGDVDNASDTENEVGLGLAGIRSAARKGGHLGLGIGAAAGAGAGALAGREVARRFGGGASTVFHGAGLGALGGAALGSGIGIAAGILSRKKQAGLVGSVANLGDKVVGMGAKRVLHSPGGAGGALGRGMMRAGNFIGEHPKATLGIAGGAAAGGLMAAGRKKQASFEEIAEVESRCDSEAGTWTNLEEGGSIAQALENLIDPAVLGLARTIQTARG